LNLYQTCAQLFHSEAKRYFIRRIPFHFQEDFMQQYDLQKLILRAGDERKLIKHGSFHNIKSIQYRGDLESSSDSVSLLKVDFRKSKLLKWLTNLRELQFDGCLVSHFKEIHQLPVLQKLSIKNTKVDFKGAEGKEIIFEKLQELELIECDFKNGSCFRNLKKLFISGGSGIRYVSKIGPLDQLEELIVVDTRIEGTVCLPNIRKASFQNVEWPQLHDLTKSTKLEKLVMQDMVRLPGDLDDFWTFFKELKELVIDCIGIAITSIGPLPKLHSLTVNHNRIGLSLFLRSNPQLKKLTITRLEDDDYCAFWNLFPRYCNNIKELVMEGPYGIHLHSIPLFTQLERLEIRNPRASIKGAQFLYPLEKLRFLTITNSDIKKLESFHFLTSLVELRLPGNRIRNLKKVEFLPLLQYLDISGNYIRDVVPIKNPQLLIKWK
jgi:Leucine-rich repeat (LRR) protein